VGDARQAGDVVMVLGAAGLAEALFLARHTTRKFSARSGPGRRPGRQKGARSPSSWVAGRSRRS
jgi:hypothetical protein